MLSQGSATQADGPPHGNTSSYPTMTDRREAEMGGWGGGGLAWKSGRRTREQSNQKRQDGKKVT